MKSNTVSRYQNIPNPASQRAFTLVELLVVVAILALLAAMSLPALCKTNIKSQGFQCMSNLKTLTAAWTSYSLDNNELLLDSRAWVKGDVSNPGSLDFVDAYQTNFSTLNVYLGGNVKPYKCPSDPRVSTLIAYNRTPVSRSVSMNGYIGQGWTSGYLLYKRTSHLTRPGPANTNVLLDEASASINDGFFAVEMDSYDPNNLPGKSLVDIPAAYHSKAGSFSFADGHAELHRWKDVRTLNNNVLIVTYPSNLDVDWLQSKSSAKITNPTR